MRTEWPLNRFNCVFGSSIKSSITLVKTWKVGVVKGMESPHPHPWCSTSAICLAYQDVILNTLVLFFEN